MALCIVFLLTSIMTARLLERKKLRVAAVAYSVMFIIMAIVLLFTVDAAIIRDLMVQLFGRASYFSVHFAFLDAICTPLYGVCMMGAILLTVAVQLAVAIFCTAQVVAYHFSKKKPLAYRFKKAHDRFVYAVYRLRLSQNLNLFYCRMLS